MLERNGILAGGTWVLDHTKSPSVDVRCRFVGWDNGRGLSISQKSRVQKDNGRGRVLELADQRQFAEERAADVYALERIRAWCRRGSP